MCYYSVIAYKLSVDILINHLTCSGVRWLHLKVFNAIQVTFGHSDA